MNDIKEVRMVKILPFGMWGQMAFILNIIIVGLFMMPGLSPLQNTGSLALQIVIWYAFISSLAIMPLVVYQTKDEEGWFPFGFILFACCVYAILYLVESEYLYLGYAFLFASLFYYGFKRISNQEGGDTRSAGIIVIMLAIISIGFLLMLKYSPPSGATIDPEWGDFNWDNFTTIIIVFAIAAGILLGVELYFRYKRNETIIRPIGKTFTNAFKKNKEPIDFPDQWKKRERKYY